MIRGHNPVIQALLASLFTWGVTALGAAVVFILPHNSKKFLDASLGFAAGVMTAASFWSLLAPAIEISEEQMGKYAFVPVAVGFACGAAFVALSDRLIPSCVRTDFSVVDFLTNSATADTQITTLKDAEADEPTCIDKRYSQCAPSPSSAASSISEDSGSPPYAGVRKRKSSRKSGESPGSVAFRQTPSPDASLLDVENRSIGPDTQSVSLMSEESQQSWRRILLLILAVTVHNIPEGLAVGVGFGSVGQTPAATFESAFNLALGIGLQNFPEGLAVSLPLAGFGYTKTRAFLYGQLSGMVEPIAALAGAAAVILMEPVLPYALSFAAGAMIYVVADDIIPEAQRNGNGTLASLGTIAGFIVMMCMDVGLG
ncbi:hypothetical protein L596_007398 [Steinernema carpocapsae]|uniref:Zinc transporter ZIP11 n=1 Tax=Steinernema carpocapsae TaxID=34508 RepID=A0A4V6A5Z4_STECR|nr:hypothetical protein L596_007398 [Steinernema carpocapsae]